MWENQSPPQAKDQTVGYSFSQALILFIWSQELPQVPHFFITCTMTCSTLTLNSRRVRLTSLFPVGLWGLTSHRPRWWQAFAEGINQPQRLLCKPFLVPSSWFSCTVNPLPCPYHVLGTAQRWDLTVADASGFSLASASEVVWKVDVSIARIWTAFSRVLQYAFVPWATVITAQRGPSSSAVSFLWMSSYLNGCCSLKFIPGLCFFSSI